MSECRKWTDSEIELIMSKRYRDAELAKMFNRNIHSIRTKRYLLRQEKKPKPQHPHYANGVCNETCPDYCPYKDCRMSGASILMAQYRKKVSQ